MRLWVVLFCVCFGGACSVGALFVAPTLACDADRACPPSFVCQSAACVAEGEGEGEGEGGEGEGEEGEGEGEGEQGEGEGEGDEFVDVLRVGDGVDEDEFAPGVAADLVVDLRAGLGDPSPFAGRLGAGNVELAGGFGSDVAFELVLRAPNVGGAVDSDDVIVDGLAASGDGLLVKLAGGELVVDLGQWESAFPCAGGAWHHLVCVATRGATEAGEVRCVFDGASRAALSLDDGTALGGGSALRVLVGSTSDAVVAVLRLWTFRDELAAPAALARLTSIEQTRLHHALGLFGLLPRRFDLGALAAGGRVLLGGPQPVLVAPTWPRREELGLLLEPARTELATAVCAALPGFSGGVPTCDVSANVGVDINIPAVNSTLTFFTSADDIDVVDAAGCDVTDGFALCRVSGPTAVSIRAPGGARITLPHVDTGPITTQAGPEAGARRDPDRSDLAWSDDDPVLVVTVALGGEDPVDLFDVLAIDAVAGGGACDVDADCDIVDRELCNEGVCGVRRAIGRVDFDGAVLRFNGVADTQFVAVDLRAGAAAILLRRVGVFGCPDEDEVACAAFDAAGAARVVFGADPGRDDTGRAFVVGARVLGP